MTALSALLIAKTATAQTSTPEDDLDRLDRAVSTARPASAQTNPHLPPLNLRAGDTLDLAFSRHSFTIPPPVQNSPKAINRLYLDMRWQTPPAGDFGVHLSDRINLVNTSKQAGSTCDCLRNDLRELYTTWSPGDAIFVDLGWTNFRNGVASAFNPTDVFKDRAVLDFDTADASVLREDRLGPLMARGQYVFDKGSITAAYAPRLSDPDPFGEPNSAVSFRTGRINAGERFILKGNVRLGRDFAPEVLVFKTHGDWRLGVNLTRGLGDKATAYVEAAGGSRRTLAADAIQFGILTGALPAQATTPVGDDGKQVLAQLAAGVNYTTNANVTLSVEYDYNGAGLSPDDWRAWMKLGAAAPGLLVRGQFWYAREYAQQFQEPFLQHNIFVRAGSDNAFIRDLSLSGLAIVSPVDGSAIIQGGLDYSINGGYSFGLVAFSSVGAHDTQYGSLPSKFGIAFSISYYIK